jgi:uncharacterized protein (TIGR00159 family)
MGASIFLPGAWLSASIFSLGNIQGLLNVVDGADVIATAVFLFIILRLFRRTKTISMAATVVVAVVLAYTASYWLGLSTLLRILKLLLANVVIILAIVFQKELRRFFELIDVRHVANIPRYVKNIFTPRHPRDAIDTIAHTAWVLAASKTGALMVFPGKESIDGYVAEGIELDGKVSEQLLLSIFDTSSPGHDGAVIIEGDTIKKFGVFLPLSDKEGVAQFKKFGTRHRSALGLSERTDALCVAVSEERGEVTIFRDGNARAVRTEAAFAAALREFLQETGTFSDAQVSTVWHRRMRGAGADALIAIVLSVSLWLFLTYPNLAITQRALNVHIEVANVPAGVTIDRIQPAEVSLSLSGAEGDFRLLDPTTVRVVVDASAFLKEPYKPYYYIPLTQDNAHYPQSFSFVSLSPKGVTIVPSITSAAKP